MVTDRHSYGFRGEFSDAIFKALGLEGRKIRRLIITMEVDQPVTLQVDEYATFADDQPYLVANLLKLATFSNPDSSAGYYSAQQSTTEE